MNKEVQGSLQENPITNSIIIISNAENSLPNQAKIEFERKEPNLEKNGVLKDEVLIGDRTSIPIKKRKEYSKYDFIKVRVTLGEHFYVLSRFLVSRMLTLCQVTN